jgi:hypothetical protein
MKRFIVIPILFASLALQAQPARVATASAQEFPALLTHDIEAGKTTTGTPVNARLMMGTLMSGVVIPEGAVLSGTVEESVAAKDKAPARLRVHITQVQWQSRTAPLNIYLVDQFYPKNANQSSQNAEYDASSSGRNDVKLRTRNTLERGGFESHTTVEVSDPASSMKSADSIKPDPPHPGQNSGLSPRAKLKNATAVRDGEGRVTILSSDKKLKLDRGTCYSFEGVATNSTAANPPATRSTSANH